MPPKKWKGSTKINFCLAKDFFNYLYLLDIPKYIGHEK